MRTKLPVQSLLHSSQPRERRAGQLQFKLKIIQDDVDNMPLDYFVNRFLATGGSSSGTQRPTPSCQSSDSPFSRKPSSSWISLHQGLESTGLLLCHIILINLATSFSFDLTLCLSFSHFDLTLIICHFQLLALLHVRLLHGVRPGVQVQLGDRGGWKRRRGKRL